MSRSYRDDPNKIPLGDRRPWPNSHHHHHSGPAESGSSGLGSLLNPSYLSGMGGKESASSSANGNDSFASIPSKFSQEFQSRWGNMPAEYADMAAFQPSKPAAVSYDSGNNLKRSRNGT